MQESTERCPDCHSEFSKLIRPRWKMQKKAVVLFLIGIALFFPWAAFMFLVLSAVPIEIYPRNGLAAVMIILVTVAIALAPSLVVGAFALKIPKIITLRCSKCRWTGVKVRGSVR